MVDQSYSESVNKSLITYTVQSKSAFNLVVACESSLNIFPGDVYHSNNAALNTWRTIDILRLFSTTGQSQDLIRHIRFVHDQCPFFRKVLRKHLPCIEWRSFFSAVEESQFTSLKWQHLNLQLLWNRGRPSLQFSSYQSRNKWVKIFCIRVLQRYTRLEGVWPPVIRIGHHWVQYHYYTDEVW